MYQVKKEFKDSIITVGKHSINTTTINPNQYEYFISIGFGAYFEEIIKCLDCDGLGCNKCEGFGIISQEATIEVITPPKKKKCTSCKQK